MHVAVHLVIFVVTLGNVGACPRKDAYRIDGDAIAFHVLCFLDGLLSDTTVESISMVRFTIREENNYFLGILTRFVQHTLGMLQPIVCRSSTSWVDVV